MNTVVTINGVSYTALQRAQNRFGLDTLELSLDGYDGLEMHEFGAPPTPSVKRGWPVSVAIDGTTYFNGWFTDIQTGPDGLGWKHGYRAQGRRWYVDRFVPVTGTDGTGDYTLNTTPDDVYGVPTDRGLTIGTILARLLTVPVTAQRLNAIGVGNYTSLTPPTLPSTTTADLALLTVVPPLPAMFSGTGLFSQIASFVSHWMPRFVTQLQADGTIRFKDMTDIGAVGSGKTFISRTFTLPSMFGSGDPIVPLPTIKTSIANIATNFQVRGGPEVEGQLLSLVDGTLVEGFTSTDKTNWTLYSFTEPGGAEDHGTITTCTSTSATLLSHDATVTWPLNFWSTRTGTVFLANTTSTGITPYVFRQVTSCDAMTAGGTATVHWDASWPTAETDFNAYRIVGSTGGLQNTWRLYLPKDPLTGNTGLTTIIGQHMVRKSPVPIYWSNKTTTIGEYYTQAVVVGPGGVSLPLGCEPVPSLGGYMFNQPTVTVFGNEGRLQQGSPTTANDGLPVDVQVFALFSTRALTAVYPPNSPTTGDTVYQGTASDTWQVTQYIDISSWTWANNQADMTTLAEEYFKASSDVVYDVTLNWLVCHGTVPSWDYLAFDWTLNVAISGTTSPWSAIDCTVTSAKINWQGTPIPQILTFGASNQMTPFTGDELYTHPQFAGTSALGSIQGEGGLFGTGMMPMTPNVTATDVINGMANSAQQQAEGSSQAATAALQQNIDFGQSLGPVGGGDGDQFTAANAHKEFGLDGNRFTPQIQGGTGFRDANQAVPGLPDATPTNWAEANAARKARKGQEAGERQEIKARSAVNENFDVSDAEARMAQARREAAEQHDLDRIDSNKTTKDMLSQATDDGSDTVGGG